MKWRLVRRVNYVKWRGPSPKLREVEGCNFYTGGPLREVAVERGFILARWRGHLREVEGRCMRWRGVACRAEGALA